MFAVVISCLTISALLTQPLSAEEPKPKVLVTNLENPSGIAIQEGSGDVFVASRYGVYRYKPGEKDRAKKNDLEIINSFEIQEDQQTGTYGKGPIYSIGPLGLAFMDGEHLVVGDGSRVDGDEYVRVYKIGAERAKPWQTEDQAAFTLGPIKAGEQSVKGEGNFYGVAVGAGAIFVTCNGDDTKGWVAKSVIAEGKPGELTPAIATKVATTVDAPVPVTFTADGSQLVVGQMGEITVEGDSLLTFYDPASGELKKSLTTGLNDIAGLAYSPSGKLYATDFSWMDSSKGGLFELVIGADDASAVEAKKILSLDKPTAITFDKEGRLYLATFGTAKEGDDPEKSPGTLQSIEPGL